MFDFIDTFDAMTKFYFYIGIFGSSIFFILNILMFIGIIDEIGFDVDLDLELVDSTLTPFRLITFRGVVAFIMFFGWSGFLTDNIIYAILFGLLAFISIGLIYHYSKKLQDSGNYSIENTIGREAEVYLRIKGDMTTPGKILIKLSNGIREHSAISEESLEYKDKVIVVDTLDNLLIVKKIKGEN